MGAVQSWEQVVFSLGFPGPYVENVRAKTNMKTHPDPLLLILSGNKTRLSGRLIGEPCLTVTANTDDHCVSFSRVVRE